MLKLVPASAFFLVIILVICRNIRSLRLASPPLIFVLLAVSTGCTAVHSTVTVYDLKQDKLNELRTEVMLCRAAGAKAIPDQTLFWWSAGILGVEHATSVATNNCLLSRGWQPKLQFAGSFKATPSDLEEALKKCGAEGGYAGLMAKAEFSGMVAENIVTSAAKAENGSAVMNELSQCMASFGWRIIDKPPWIPPDEAAASYVAEPIAENIADKFVVKNQMIRDNGNSIYWMQENPEDSRGLDWHDARYYVAGLNKIRLHGFSDWRIPRRDEVASLLNFARWSAASDMAALLKKLGFNGVEGAIYWTSSPVSEDASGNGIWGVNFATREYVRLGRSKAFSANVIPVRGRGWGAKELELPLHEPSDKEGQGEIIAARYHRWKENDSSPGAGNRP